MENAREKVNRLFADAYLEQETFRNKKLPRISHAERNISLPQLPEMTRDFYRDAIDSLTEVRRYDPAVENSLLTLKRALESAEKAAAQLKTYYPDTYKEIDQFGRLRAHREEGRPNKRSFDLIGDDLLTEIAYRKIGINAELSTKDLPARNLTSGNGVLRAPKRNRPQGFSDSELGALVALWRRSLGLIETDITEHFVNDVSPLVAWYSISKRRGHFSMIAALILETSQESICKRIRDRRNGSEPF